MDASTDWVVSGGRYALDFDGVDDWIDVPRVGDFIRYGTASIGAWIWAAGTSFGTSDSILTHVFDGTSVQFVLSCGNNPLAAGSQRVWGGFFNGAWRGVVASQDNVFQSWQHYCVTYNGAIFAIFINGRLSATSAVATSVPTTLSPSYRIARRWDSSVSADNLFQGMLDDIRIYNRALSPAEIRLLATRRGIAYERRKRRQVFFDAAFFNPAWARNSNVILSPVGAA